ncbi:copper resistance protein B [Alteraurantiacibacter aestuarii]|uniref:Copper resistance protein B n=1 Tax=Alteraurantiacibacter aestuarii TaxID=650004 RepID=A0A844ZJJ0_9SPHN|nr:copper resistance protein B [Alteraurantiacibacter aestuarii]MXO87633.1 copper resistance protein B [Alteraurantiacibacter aestuarii]
MRYLLALPLLALAAPLAAQDHDHSATSQTAPDQAEPAPAPSDHSEMDHSAMDHSTMDHSTMDHSTMDHSTMDHSTMDHSAMGHDMPPASNSAPPARALEGPLHAADAIWGEAAMRPAREQMAIENGTFRTASLLVERFEARLGSGDAYLWDMQGFIGGDLDRLVIKTEGEGEFGGALDDAEVQALWSHAITPFFDLQMGARLDVEPDTRSHAVLGVQGLAPYMIHLDAAAFLSDRGDVTARIEAEYDQKITQRVILQPRVEVELAAQDIAERDIGAGFTSFAAGLRLRYEIVREFAPYVGVEWSRKLGRTADIARLGGDDPSATAVLVGIRTWF